jgi:hypothetical protein
MERALPDEVRQRMDEWPLWFDASSGNLRCAGVGNACDQSVLRTHEHGRDADGAFLVTMHPGSRPAAYNLTAVRSAVYAHLLQAHRDAVWPERAQPPAEQGTGQ